MTIYTNTVILTRIECKLGRKENRTNGEKKKEGEKKKQKKKVGKKGDEKLRKKLSLWGSQPGISSCNITSLTTNPWFTCISFVY